MPPDESVYADRARAESFGSAAVYYDRFRPSYPAELIDDLVALNPADVLDAGCGTGKAAVPMTERGLAVLGVEVDARMADVARGHGIPVEVASFESWDAGGRRFDLITCAQAWHWIDPVVGVAKAVELLRPGGTLALFWNYDELDERTQHAVLPVYRRLAPELMESVVIGGNRQSGCPHAAGFEASGRFASVRQRTYHWQDVRTTAQWLALTATHSDHLRLEAARRAQLSTELAAALEPLGGTVTSGYGTYVVFARVPV